MQRSKTGLIACVVRVADATVDADSGLGTGLVVTSVDLTIQNTSSSSIPATFTSVDFMSLKGVPAKTYSFAESNSVFPTTVQPGQVVTVRFYFSNTAAERSDYRVSWGDCIWFENPAR